MTHPTPVLRPTLPGDAEAIAAIERASNPSPWTATMLRHALGVPGRVGLVALHEDALLGHTLSSTVLDEAEMLLIAVDPAMRRFGTGRHLLDALQQAWRIAGVTRATLEVRASNSPAISLYLSLGWTLVGARRGYYADGEDAQLYEWRASR